MQEPMAQQSAAIRVRIEGQVQGVGFRAWTVDEAVRLGLDGWVRNCSDGSVEAVFAGPQPSVDQMLSLVGHGPASAEVADLVVEPVSSPPEPGFRQLPTS